VNKEKGNLPRFPSAGTQAAKAGEVQGTDYQGRVLYAGCVTMDSEMCVGVESED
jgi:hypothetical protein